MNPVHLIFIGTSSFGVPLLQALAVDDRIRIPLVVTAPPRLSSRGLERVPSPVERTATAAGLPVFQPEEINAAETVTRLRGLRPDLMLVVSYGQLLKRDALSIPGHGCLNVHGSLLPKYRGASPIQSALLADETTTGITLIRMTEGMDAGPVYFQSTVAIRPLDNAITLHERLAEAAGRKVPHELPKIVQGQRKAVPQDEAEATTCAKIEKSDGRIDWREPASAIAAKIRAYAGWPGTFTTWKGRHLKILAGRAAPTPGDPGTVFTKSGRVLAGTSSGSVELTSVQMEGKKAMPVIEFIKGYPDFTGSTLGT